MHYIPKATQMNRRLKKLNAQMNSYIIIIIHQNREENLKNSALISLNLYLLLIHEKLFFVLNYTKNENNAQPRHVHELRRTLFGHRWQRCTDYIIYQKGFSMKHIHELGGYKKQICLLYQNWSELLKEIPHKYSASSDWCCNRDHACNLG